MKKIARSIYVFFGAVMPILIGSLHTYVHFKDLMNPSVRGILTEYISVMGESQLIWNTWGVISFMMGAAFIVIGCLNLVILRMLKKDAYPPVFAILLMMIYLSCAVYVGYQFEAAQQFYGGLVGLGFMTGCLFLSIKGETI